MNNYYEYKVRLRTGVPAKMQAQRCNNANSPGPQVGAFSHLLEYFSELSSSDECNVYTADSFLKVLG